VKSFEPWRNFLIIFGYLGTCCYMIYASDYSAVGNLGPAFIGLGTGTAGCVVGRALNKKYESSGNGG
jgi:hypothetical protein